MRHERSIPRTAARTALGAVLALAQVSSAFAGTITLNGAMNARTSSSFRGSENVKAVFPKGTEGDVLERQKLPSGNYGIKLKIKSLGGPSENLHVGDEVWVYYHMNPEHRYVAIYDDDRKPVEDPTQGKWAVATKSFRTDIPTRKARVRSDICASCLISTKPTEDLKPVSDEFMQNLKPAINLIAKKNEEDDKSIPDLDASEQEVLTYLEKVNENPSRKSLLPTIAKTVVTEAKKQGVPIALVIAILRQETVNFNPKDHSKAGARGLMQIMPATWRGLGGGSLKGAYDPVKNIQIGVKELASDYREYNGDLTLVLIAYNAGPGRIKNYEQSGLKGLPKETQAYIPAVTAYYNAYTDYAKKTSNTMLARN